MKPLIKTHRLVYPNIGTVVNFQLFDTAPVKYYSVGRFRQNHPEVTVDVTYGVFVTNYPDLTPGLGHGDFLRFSDGDKTRFYWWPTANRDVDLLLIKRQMLLDWEREGENQPRQIHWPDLCWFDPPYGAPGWQEVRSREELGAEINRRLRALDLDV